jgi:hypothetical protein
MSSPETALRTTVHATLDGWPVDIEIEITPARLGAALARLSELGYTPRAAAAPAQHPTPVSGAPSAGPACCPLHGTAKVKESERRPGTYFCAAKMGDGSYCKERPI